MLCQKLNDTLQLFKTVISLTKTSAVHTDPTNQIREVFLVYEGNIIESCVGGTWYLELYFQNYLQY